MADGVPINLGVGGSTIASDDIGGQQYQRMKIIHGADGVNDGDVANANPLPVRIQAASPATTVIGTVQPPTITKGSQPTLGFGTQDLKDSGRAVVNASTVIAGVAAVAAEAMITMDVARDFGASASITTIPVTAGKKYRITGIMVGLKSTAAAVLSGRFALRVNPSGAAVIGSPAAFVVPVPSGAALAEAGGMMMVPIPGEIELSGTMQVGISQLCSAATGLVWAALIGYEY